MTNQTIATKMTTGMVRFSYCHIWEPTDPQGTGNPKYSMSILIPKTDTKTVTKIQNCTKAAYAAGKDKLANKMGVLPTLESLKTPLRDGDTDANKGGDPNYAGMYFINCSTNRKPQIVDSACNEILDKSAVYSGCYGKVSLNFYAYEFSGNKGVAAGLNNIQFLQDGEPLGGFSTAQDDFGSEDDGDVLG